MPAIETEGVPGIDAGTGWSQEGKLTISTGIIEGSFSELPRDLWDGCLAMDGTVSENMIPVPLDYKGKIELRLESWAQVSEIISISGKGARLELIGEAEYVEEFKP